MSKKSLDAFLASDEAVRSSARTSQCSTCSNIPVAKVVEQFLDKKAAGLTHVQVSFFQERYLGPNFGYKFGRSTLTRHIKKCLEREVTNGMPFSPDRQPKVMERIERLKAKAREES